MNIVIIGAGKIGVTLTEQLAREGHNITVIDNRAEALTDIGRPRPAFRRPICSSPSCPRTSRICSPA